MGVGAAERGTDRSPATLLDQQYDAAQRRSPRPGSGRGAAGRGAADRSESGRRLPLLLIATPRRSLGVSVPRVLYHMARADFLERVRRYSFLLTLAGALYLAYGVATEKVRIIVGNGYRGVYNSAWIGMLMTVSCATFLSLVGFYIVKNSLQPIPTRAWAAFSRPRPCAKPFTRWRKPSAICRPRLHGSDPHASRAGHATDAR